MHVEMALEAIEKGCCLEIHDGHEWLMLDPQAVGVDDADRPLLLGVERSDERCAPLAKWLVIRLDRARFIAVSGYFSDGARAGWEECTRPFDRILGSVPVGA